MSQIEDYLLPAGSETAIHTGSMDGNDYDGMEISFEKSSDLYLIRIDGVERYEIPDALVYGG